jgi:virginiamycin B lyase
MTMRRSIAAGFCSFFAIVFLTGATGVMALAPASAQTPALTGKVTAEQGPLEGVLVSARKDGSTVTITVVSDKDGRYSFPAAKLEPGHMRCASAPSASISTMPSRSRWRRAIPRRPT